MAKIILYKDNNFRGDQRELSGDESNFKNINFNDVLSSAVVESGTWQIYSDVNFGEPSVTLSATGGPSGNGKYPSADSMGGRNDYFSSIRLVNDKG